MHDLSEPARVVLAGALDTVENVDIMAQPFAPRLAP